MNKRLTMVAFATLGAVVSVGSAVAMGRGDLAGVIRSEAGVGLRWLQGTALVAERPTERIRWKAQ